MYKCTYPSARSYIYIYTIPLKLGVLMFACGIDGCCYDGDAVHVAFCVFGVEDEISWELFLDCLKGILPVKWDSFTIVTDFSNIATLAVQKILPNSHHRFFRQHMVKTFVEKFAKFEVEYDDMICKAANVCNQTACKDALQKIKEINEDAYDWLKKIGLARWTNAFSSPYDRATPAVCLEKLEKLRNWPIVKIVEGTRDMVAGYFSFRQKEGALMESVLTRQMLSELELVKKFSWTVAMSKENKYLVRRKQVIDLEESSYQGWLALIKEDKYLVCGEQVVNLEERSCSCYEFQVYNFPCYHAIAVIVHEELDASKYYKHWYTANTYRATYAGNIPPIADISKWQSVLDNEQPRVLLPKTKRRVGRPRKKTEILILKFFL
ncbi:hypothetical protein AQUCO_04400016v1 [Aquilegia coerulea]|uniref:SWIM-type domain-containing protein n=1 Tax=Aquilegia coerulea TaxID=218851 RepID=A0A2G5CMJ9_AQUCA|nr:hypothetical protein AQUCO_04400016v1 [Aquilegia coerulea]